MIVIHFLGKHDEVLKAVELPPNFASIRIREVSDHKEHFPENLGFPAWNSKRKISDLPVAPANMR